MIRLESRPISSTKETTAFGIFGVSPESPDGSRICYTRFLATPSAKTKDPVPAELWVCHHDLSNHTKVADLSIKPIHNAARAAWVDNTRLSFTTHRITRVLDVENGSDIVEPVEGDTGHEGHGACILYWTVDGENPSSVAELDADSGISRTIVTTEQICDVYRRDTGRDLEPFSVKHLQYSTDGQLICFRLHGPTTEMLSMRPDGSQLHVYPTQKPVHQLWFDNDTIMGAWKRSPPEGKRSHFFRWSLDGEVIEELAGSISHGAASPDRMWYAGETCEYFDSPIRMALYRRGETAPAAVCFDHDFADITWERRYHVNPAFSRDGTRLYFWQAVSDSKVEARFVDLHGLLDK